MTLLTSLFGDPRRVKISSSSKSGDAFVSPESENLALSVAIDVAGRFSRGNIALQSGLILTEERMEAERAFLRDDGTKAA